MTHLSIGEKLTLLRSRKKLSKKQLSNLTDMHWTSISKYERNEATPSIDALRKLSIALDVSSDYLIFDENQIKPNISDDDLFDIMAKMDQLSPSDRQSLKSMILSFISSKEG